MALYDIQTTGAADYAQYIKALICGAPGSGKGLPLDTPVLTPDGWTPIGKLEVGDSAIGSSGQAVTLTDIFDRGVQPMFQVSFDDGASITCDADHLWTVDTGKVEKVLSTSDLAEMTLLEHREGRRPRPKLRIPVVAAVQHDKVELPLKPYTLGVLLANGALTAGTITFTTNDEFIAKRVMDENPDLAIRETTPNGATARRWQIDRFASTIRTLGLDVYSKDKFVPEIYLTADESARRDLLAALVDCDGTAPSGRRPIFFSTSPQLRDDVVALVRSLGGVTRISVDARDENPCFRVSILIQENIFSLPRKAAAFSATTPWRGIASITPTTPDASRCIKVDADDELFVTDEYIVTHNTKFSATSPKPFMLSAEGGLMSIADESIPFITFEKVGGYAGLKTLLETLRQDPQTRKEQLGLEVETFVIDTIDEVGRLLMREHLAGERVANPRIQDYGWLKDTMTSFVRAVRNLDMNVVMTAHLKSVSDGSDNSPQKYLPAIDGSFSEAIPGYVDLAFVLRNDLATEMVGNQLQRSVHRWLQTYPEPMYDWIKDRSGKLPQKIEVTFDGDFGRIADVIFGKTPGSSAALPESPVAALTAAIETK